MMRTGLLGFPLAALCLFAAPTAANAQSQASGPTAADLLRLCVSSVEGGEIRDPMCQGYMAGYVGAIRASEPGPDEGSDYPICLPDGSISNRDLVAGLSTYILGKPEVADRPARDVMFEMLASKAPCAAPDKQTDSPKKPDNKPAPSGPPPAMIQPR